MNQTRQLPPDPGSAERIPAGIDSVSAKLVYVAVRQEEPVGAPRLKAALGMPGLTLYPILRQLTRAGHLELTDGAYALA